MSVAKVIEISSTSTTSFEHAIKEGIRRASASVKGMKGAWVKEQQIKIEGNEISEYRVNLQVTFVLEG